MGWYGDTDNGRVCWFIMLAPKGLILLTVLVGLVAVITVTVLNGFILRSALKTIVRLQRADQSSYTSSIQISADDLRISRNNNPCTQHVSAQPDASDAASKQTSTATTPSVGKPTKWKAVKIVSFTFGSFVVTWCPYFITSLIYTYCGSLGNGVCDTLKLLIASPLAMLGLLNSLLNPVIYVWWHKGFRQFVRQKVGMLFKKSKADISGKAGNDNKSVN